MDALETSFETIEITISSTFNKVFYKLEDVREFIEEERKFFDFLWQVSRRDGNLQNSINTKFNIYDEIITNIANVLPSRKNQNAVETSLKAIKTRLESSYKNHVLIFSNSNEAAFLKQLAIISPEVSGFAYAYISNQSRNTSWTSHYAVRGAIEASFFLRGINENTSAAVENALEEIRNKTQKHLDEYTEKENRLERKFDEALRKNEDMLKQKKSEFEKVLTEKIANYDAFYKDANEKLENVNKAYRQYMTLKAPVEYFGDLRLSSYLRALGALVLVLIYSYFGGSFVIRQVEKIELLTKENVSYGKIMFFVLLASAFVWLLRIIVRYLLGQLHIANESTEKMVMTKTFLALLQDGKLEVSERELVLRNVFRPSSAALLGEEHPHPAMEIINNIQKTK